MITGTISPLDQLRPSYSMYSALNLLFPSACAVVVLSVISVVAFLVICKKRPGFDDSLTSSGHHPDQMCSVMRGDDPYLLRSLSSACDSNTTGRGGGILSILDQRKESSCLSEMTETPSKIYVSSRYALNQLHQYHQQQQQLQMEQDESGDSCETTAKQHQQLRHDHQQLQQQLEQQGLSLRVIERDESGNLLQSGQPLSFGRRGLDHHTYDVPLPAKWV